MNISNLKLTNNIINDELFEVKLKLESKIYYHVINLINEKDKFIKSEIEYSKLKLFQNNFDRFDAIKPTMDVILKNKIINIEKFWQFTNLQDVNNVKYCIGASGCKLSHYNLLKKINQMKNNYKYHLIFEDDFFILDTEKSIIRLGKVINYIEKNNIDFNILYLGCNFSNDNGFEIINENLLKCNKGYGFTTHAMLFKKSNIDYILKKIENSEKEIDVVYTELEKRYVIFPMIAIQRNDVSNIGSHKNNYLLKDNKIFYGDFNKKFIYDKINKFIHLQQ
jgi:GR25 family glycosyltransferase involved in LPS biosynthesis